MIEPASISLYIDEDASLVLADLLQGYGFTVVTTRDAENLGRDDDFQLTYATDNSLAMFTHNRRDFLVLHRAWQIIGRSHAGIFAAHRNPPHELLRRLLPILGTVTAAEMYDQFRYV